MNEFVFVRSTLPELAGAASGQGRPLPMIQDVIMR
jgi:hypothetical protein